MDKIAISERRIAAILSQFKVVNVYLHPDIYRDKFELECLTT